MTSYASRQLAADPSSASATASSAAALPSNHPICRRIRSILLQPSINEANLTEALDTLADLYTANGGSGGSGGSSSSPSMQVRRTLSTPVDTDRARRNVERDARKRVLKATDDFIAVLSTVDGSLAQLSDDIKTMHRSCDQLESRLDRAFKSSGYLVEHARGLQRQREATELQRRLSSLFLERFTLSENERDAIHSGQVRVGSHLFAAMDHLDQMRADCRVLLEGADANGVGGGTRAGMDIMKATADDLEAAHQKIFKWISFEFRQPIKEGLEVSRHLREAVRRLMRARQDLLRTALSTLVTTRSSILLNAFVGALTIGGPAPTYLPRPIELHAHDPLRYVGDMLAWIHQTLASERELLTALFGEKEGEGGRRIGQRRRGLEGSIDLSNVSDPDTVLLGPGEALVREVLNRNLEGCCRPLRIRVQQTVRLQEGSVTTYRLSHLIHFYRLTMEKTIGRQAVLSQTLGDISQISLDAFYTTLDRQAAGLARFQGPIESSLTAPPPLLGVSGTLKELLAEYQRALADEGEQEGLAGKKEEKKREGLDDFDPILDKLVSPMVELCERMAETVRGTRPSRGKDDEKARWEAGVFLENCLGFIVNLLRPYAFTHGKVEEIEQLARKERTVLVDLHYAHLLSLCGLSPLLSTLSKKSSSEPLSHLPSTTPTLVSSYLAQFNDFLSSSEVISPSRLVKLESPTLRNEIHQRVLRKLTDDYAKVVEALKNERNKYEWNMTLVRRSREEVEVLLGWE